MFAHTASSGQETMFPQSAHSCVPMEEDVGWTGLSNCSQDEWFTGFLDFLPESGGLV